MKLKKIRLVNWHMFNDHLIELEGNTVLTGSNGNGKSTLIDAIYFVLSGGDEKSFNNAANSESSRTLITYVRCKFGAEGKEFKRNENDINAHIALEFFDEFENKARTLGVVIQLTGNKASKYFYILDDMGVSDVEYVNEDKIVADYEDIKRICKGHFDGMPPSTSMRTIRSKIEDLLQLNNSDSYNKLLRKAIAFKPLTHEVSTFVNEFLLKEDNIDISALREEINSYRDIKKTIDKEKGKLDVLETFIDYGNIYQENLKKITYLQSIKLKENILINEKSLAKRKKEYEVVEARKNAAKKDEDIAIEKIEHYKDLITKIQNDGKFSALKELSKLLNEKKIELVKAEDAKRNQEEFILNEQHISDDLELGYSFEKKIENRDIAGLNTALQEYLITLDNRLEKANNEKFDILNSIKGNNEKIKERIEIVEALRKGRNSYEKPITELINVLNEKLSSNHNREIKVLPLCECFEIIDKRWTNAIEGYISHQRFALVVDRAYFDEALKIYDEIADVKRIYGVGLINTTKVVDYPVEENSLYTKIKVKNSLVDTKLKQLLGRVICVEDRSELKNYDSAITASCMVYKNLIASRINPAIYQTPFIGKESQEERIQMMLKQISILKEDNKRLNDLLDQNKEILTIIKNSGLKKDYKVTDVWGDVLTIENRIEELNDQIKELGDDDELIGLQHRIEVYESEQNKANHERDEARKEKEDAIDQGGQIKNRIVEIERTLNNYKESYDLDVKNNSYGEDYFAYENKVLSTPTFRIEDETNMLRSNLKTYEKIINKGMMDYYNLYEKNLGTSIDDLDKYIAKYNQIKETDIVIYNQKAQEAYETAKSSFNEKFVSALREKIKYAQASLREINKVLQKHPFGADGEIYTFTFKASGDKELANYYRVITSDKAYGQIDLLVESMSDEDQQIIKDLFERIASDEDDSSAESALHTFLDYRSYMNYDIKITNKNKEEYFFSKIAKEKSGGETQTPFYVVIAACFEQLIKKNSISSSCIIIFDEAFNNMDESRIATLLNYYKQLSHIQFMIGVPTNRAPLLVPSMDDCIGLLKKNNTVEFFKLGKING